MKQITPAVKSSVNAYLMSRAYAETQRERVDKIQVKILTGASYFSDPKLSGRRHLSERITDPKFTYLLKDNDHTDFLLDLKAELIKAGFDIISTPNEPEHYYQCPALVAETLQSAAENLVIDCAAEMLGEKDDFRHRIICEGLDKRQEFIDLAVKLVVNAPGFKNPLTGKEVGHVFT